MARSLWRSVPLREGSPRRSYVAELDLHYQPSFGEKWHLYRVLAVAS
jgi:hypothetical protein